MGDPRPKSDFTWLIIVGVFASFWVVYLYFLGPRPPDLLENSAMDRPAEFNWTLRDLQGNPVSFEKYKGKAIFLNIWATWCVPCLEEMPSIVRLAENPRIKGKNIEFVCVSTDDDLDTVRKFLQGKNWPMTILHSLEFPPVFLSDGIPATYVIAPDGKVVAAESGAAKWDDPKVIAFLERISGSLSPAQKPAQDAAAGER